MRGRNVGRKIPNCTPRGRPAGPGGQPWSSGRGKGGGKVGRGELVAMKKGPKRG